MITKVQSNAKGKGMSMEPSTANQVGTFNNEGDEDNEEDSVDGPHACMAGN